MNIWVEMVKAVHISKYHEIFMLSKQSFITDRPEQLTKNCGFWQHNWAYLHSCDNRNYHSLDNFMKIVMILLIKDANYKHNV